MHYMTLLSSRQRVFHFLVLITMLGVFQNASAATIRVDIANPNHIGVPGGCNLREAIASIADQVDSEDCFNTLESERYGENDTILLTSELTGTDFLGVEADIFITEELTISEELELEIRSENLSDRISITSRSLSRIFNVVSATLRLNGLELILGKASELANENGGAIYGNDATIEVRNSSLTRNRAVESDGGAIFVEGSSVLKVFDSQITDNEAGIDGGGISISEGSLIETENSVIARNEAGNRGGGLALNRALLVNIQTTLIEDNTARFGGGIFSDIPRPFIQTGIRDSLIVDNKVNRNEFEESAGGGIFLTASNGIRLTNTTVVANSGDNGPALFLSAAEQGEPATQAILTHSTIYNNTSFFGRAAIQLEAYSNLNIRNSIVANPQSISDLSCAAEVGALVDSDEESIVFNGQTCQDNARNVNPLLQPISGSDHSRVLPITPSSPAFDSGNLASCEQFDQRGQPRELNACDVGAYEYDKTFLIVIPLPDNKVVVVPN